MDSFQKHTGTAAFLDRMNVDTDQIIPKQFLKRVERSGFGQFLFFDWRFAADGTRNESFVLNQPEMTGASVLVTAANFGCGSSREHAAWALQDYGFRVVIAPSFADIFYNNCFKSGVLPVVLDESVIQALFVQAAKRHADGDTIQLNVDLVGQWVEVVQTGEKFLFEIDLYRKQLLLEGLDDIGVTLRYVDVIDRFEQAALA